MIFYYEAINALINMINDKKYSEDYTKKKHDIKEIHLLLAPFFVVDNNVKSFRDMCIIEFYKKFLNDSSINSYNNYLYYSLIIGLVNAYRYQDVELAVKMITPSKENFTNEHRNVMPFPPPMLNIREMFITHINEKTFYIFDFDSFSNSYLVDLNNIDYEKYMESQYPKIFRIMRNIYNPEMKKSVFPIILHFIYITKILDISQFKKFECLKVIENIKERKEKEEEETINLEALYERK